MAMNRCKHSSSREADHLLMRNVHMGIGIPELLRKSEINEMHYVGMLADSHDEIARLEVTMYKAARMNVPQARDLVIK
jgi:hypothetical protein